MFVLCFVFVCVVFVFVVVLMRGGSLLVLLLFVVGLWVGEGEGLRQKLSVDR